jgi:YVTN family beta-propeller protein
MDYTEQLAAHAIDGSRPRELALNRLAWSAMGLALMLVGGCGSSGTSSDRGAASRDRGTTLPNHLVALASPFDDGAPAGYWSLDIDNRQLLLTTPTSAQISNGEVLESDGQVLTLGPHPNCEGTTNAAVTYTVTQTDGQVTFKARKNDGCPDRQKVLTAAPWRAYVPPPRRDDVPEATAASVVARIPVDPQPANLSFHHGSLWAAAPNDNRIFGIDGATNKVSETIEAAGMSEVRWLKAGDSGLWASDSTAGVVQRIDPKKSRVTADIPVGEAPTSILLTDDEVWVTNHRGGTISVIDPAKNAVTHTIEVGPPGPGGPQEPALFEGQVHVIVNNINEIRRVDPDTKQVKPFYAGRASGGLAVTDDALWGLEGWDAGWVSRINPDGKIDLQVSIGEGRRAKALTAAEGALWVVTTGEDEATTNLELVRIDPGSAAITSRQDIGSPSEFFDIEFGDGDAWVTTSDGIVRVDA